jgi:nucleoside-diphosphate-sugar epimerase
LNKKVLLTGSTGFVGRQVLKFLQNKKVEIVLVVRRGKKEISNNKVVDIYTSDDIFSESIEWWADVCTGVDLIIHAAWYAEPGSYLYSDKNIECMQGTINMSRGAVISKVKRIVGIGTCFEYNLEKCRMLDVKVPLNPKTPYAASKVATYLLLSQYLLNCGVEFLWCRLFYLFGEGENDRRLIPYIESRLKNNLIVDLTSGEQIRDYMNVVDAGRMVVDMAYSKHVGPINICSGVPITIRQLSERIADNYGKGELLRFGAKGNNDFDPFCVVGVPFRKP